MRAAVLVSGGGTNLQAVLDACSVEKMGARALPAEVRVVLSNKPGAFALERAARAGVATEVLSHKEFATREQFDARVVECAAGEDDYDARARLVGGAGAHAT